MTFFYILSQVFIIIYYILLVSTYQLKDRKKILIFNFIALISIGISYALLSAYSGVAMTFVALIRNIIFIIDEKRSIKSNKYTFRDYAIFIGLNTAIIILAIFTYQGPLSMMAVLATMLYTYSVWQRNAKVYKILGIPIGIISIIYNTYISSIFGVILETVLAVSAIIGYIKEIKERRIYASK